MLLTRAGSCSRGFKGEAEAGGGTWRGGGGEERDQLVAVRLSELMIADLKYQKLVWGGRAALPHRNRGGRVWISPTLTRVQS